MGLKFLEKELRHKITLLSSISLLFLLFQEFFCQRIFKNNSKLSELLTKIFQQAALSKIEFALNNSTEASYNNLPSEKEFDECKIKETDLKARQLKKENKPKKERTPRGRPIIKTSLAEKNLFNCCEHLLSKTERKLISNQSQKSVNYHKS